ncbi:MAG: DUF3857 domain-containing protein [Candidatus Eisenbacteria sp.]|nr:DUF3857 domain-containing protein [Candidatus Eisenbacteria bacterium]
MEGHHRPRLHPHPGISCRLTIWTLVMAALSLTAPGIRADDPEQVAPDLAPGDHPSPTVFSRIADAGGAEDYEGADYSIVYQTTTNRVKPSGVMRGEEYVLYKILTRAGARHHAVQTWRYEPWSSFIDVREVNIIRGGERIPVDVSAVRDLPAPQSAIYWNARLKTLQLPRLYVNDGIEIRVFRKGYSYALLEGGGAGAGGAGASNEEPGDEKYIPPMPGEYFDIVLFQASVPILEKRYELHLPPEKRLHSQIYNGPLYASTSYSEEANRYAWWALDMPARPSEPRQADPSDFVAKVVVATVESWKAKSRWFFDVNESQFAVTPEVQAKVDEILESAGVADGTEAEKAEVLVHWVAQNIRYSGQTMGEGEGFTLHSGEMIFEQRSGVCKDIAGMLITMMRAAEMDSHGAMTMAGSRIEEVPADQFNHCVTALRKEDGTFVMYDPTWVPFTNDIWSKYEAEQQYLIGSAAGESLATIPYSSPEESPLYITHEAVLEEDGTLVGTFRFRGRGTMDGRLRRMATYTRILDLEDDIDGILAHVSPTIRDVRFEHPRPDDFSQDMYFEVSYRAPDFALPVGNGLEFRSPMMAVTMNEGWFFRAGVTDWPEERESEVFLWFSQLIDGTERIRLPRGYAAVETPASETIDETYAFFEGASEMDGRELVITENAEVRRRQFPAEAYEGFVQAMEEAGEWEEVLYRVTPKEEGR